jgi:hypothetical protein
VEEKSYPSLRKVSGLCGLDTSKNYGTSVQLEDAWEDAGWV